MDHMQKTILTNNQKVFIENKQIEKTSICLFFNGFTNHLYSVNVISVYL